MGEDCSARCNQWFTIRDLCNKGTSGVGKICINGAAAHLVEPGDLVILLTFQGIEEGQIEKHEPRIVHVDEQNKVIELSTTECNF